MKRLSLAQPTILLMVGVPGAGKSFFARQFADTYGLPCISADRIRFELLNEPQYTNEEQDIVHRVVNYMTDEMLKGESTFIIDSVLGNVRTQRMNIERRAREHGYKVLTVWVQVDEATARARSQNRTSKRDDQYNAPLPEGAFVAWSRQLTPPTTEQYVVISGKHTFPAQHKAVLRKLFPASQTNQQSDTSSKVVTPTPERHMDRPAPRPDNNRRIIIS